MTEGACKGSGPACSGAYRGFGAACRGAYRGLGAACRGSEAARKVSGGAFKGLFINYDTRLDLGLTRNPIFENELKNSGVLALGSIYLFIYNFHKLHDYVLQLCN